MEKRQEKLWVYGGKLQVKCGGRYRGKSGGVWKEKIFKISGFGVRLSYELTILTMKEWSYDNQKWRAGGKKMEETLSM